MIGISLSQCVLDRHNNLLLDSIISDQLESDQLCDTVFRPSMLDIRPIGQRFGKFSEVSTARPNLNA